MVLDKIAKHDKVSLVIATHNVLSVILATKKMADVKISPQDENVHVAQLMGTYNILTYVT